MTTDQIIADLRKLQAGSMAGFPKDTIEAACSALTASEKRVGELLAMQRSVTKAVFTRDHFTACDRTMGDTHPCTCGMAEYAKLLEQMQ